MKYFIKSLLFTGVLLMYLSACGGGSSGGEPDTITPKDSGSWDVMVWDQDNWS